MVPRSGETRVLEAWLETTPLRLRLFTNDITPQNTDTAAVYVEAAGGGYTSKALETSTWLIANGSASYGTSLDFTFSGPLSGNPTIYGYYVTRVSDGELAWAQRGPASFTPTASGDVLTIQLSLDAE